MCYDKTCLNSYHANNNGQAQSAHSSFVAHCLDITSKFYRKVPKFSDARKPCCNHNKIQTKMPNFRIFLQKDANGKANSEDPDQTAPL